MLIFFEFSLILIYFITNDVGAILTMSVKNLKYYSYWLMDSNIFIKIKCYWFDDFFNDI